MEDLKTKKREREELGVQLYGVQQELARQQMLLEKEHDNYNSEHDLRQQCENLLEETKQLHDKTSQEVNHQRKQGLQNGVLQKIHSPLLGARFNNLPPIWISRVCYSPPAKVLQCKLKNSIKLACSQPIFSVM